MRLEGQGDSDEADKGEKTKQTMNAADSCGLGGQERAVSRGKGVDCRGRVRKVGRRKKESEERGRQQRKKDKPERPTECESKRE